MDEKIDKVIDGLLTHGFRAGTSPKVEDALKMSQAILNLAHARQLLSSKK